MLGRLILGLLWLTCVQSDTLSTPMGEAQMSGKTSMSMGLDDSMAAAAPMTKAKRYLSHQHSSPCPPFYPHFHMHPEPMYASRPYGPPSYPKNDLHLQHQHSHQQFIHQPTYTSYAPKQTIQYVKPPVYHPPIQHPPIQHPPIQHPPIQHPPIQHSIHPVQPTFLKPPPRWFTYQPSMHQHKVEYPKQPMFSYAPAYHKPMPMIWPIKKIDYPVAEVSYPKPVYKPEPPKCEPCVQHPPPPHHAPPQPSISYVKIAQPVHQIAHQPPPSHVYLPAPVHHQSIVKPCH